MFLLATENGSLGIGVLFWILYIVGLIFYGFGFYRDPGPGRPFYFSGIFWWVLIFLLGCGVFGFPVHF